MIPAGLIAKLQGETIQPEVALFAHQRKAVEDAAMAAVMAKERELGNDPVDVSKQNLGWDIESRLPNEKGRLRFIEVKGRVEGATTVTITKNEILAALNKPDDFILAVVKVAFEQDQARAREINYIRKPFEREPDFAATSVNYNISDLFSKRMNEL